MSTEDMQGEVRDLKAKLQNYQAGSIEGLNSFKDAREGEMEGMQIKVAVFGMTGVGKSSLVNTIWKVLYGKESAPAIEQASGGEGTQILEEFHSRSASDSELGGFVFSDTRGFNFDFNNAEENELFRVLYGIESSGQHLERGEWAEEMAKEAGQAAHRLKKPPLADQVHVALWVIKGNDIRFENDQYIGKFAFVQQKLNREGVTIVTAVTHFDKLKSKNKNEVRRKAMEVTGSSRGNTFLFANWLPDEEDYDVQNQLEVLRMLKTALACGERSVKSRQVLRKLDKK